MRITTVLKAKRFDITDKIGELSKAFGNFPDSYVKRSSEQVYWETPKAPQYQRAAIEKKNFRFTTNRPWTSQFRMQNMPNMKRKKVFVEPIENWSFFRGDRVEVLVGRDKGKQGMVNQVIQERNWVIVEGLNTHMRIVGKEKNYPGVVIRSEAPLLVTSQVALVDPTDLQATEIEWRYTEEGEKVRVSKRSGRIIPIPKAQEETMDYKGKKLYMAKEKDTEEEVVQEITFEPKLATFEMDIMETMGIKEERDPQKTFCVRKVISSKTIKTEVTKQAGTEHRGSGRAELPEIRAWIPPSLRPQHGLSEEAQRDEIFRKVRGILNKLTPEKFQPLSDDLLSLNLNSKKILLGAIHLIFEKALDEPKYSSMYAQLCRRISKEGSTIEAEDSRYTFETLLIRVCQDKFVNRSQYSEKIINSTSDDIEEEEKRYIAKQKILGNVKFIGELFKLEMLNAATLHKMLEQLLDKKSRPYPTLEDRCEDMECLSQIFRTCGRQLDTDKSKNLIDQYFDNMERKSLSSKYPPRIRFMLRDIIELRKDGWKPRKVARIEGPVPIQDLSTDEEYIRQQRDMRTRTMEFPNRNSGDRNWMDKLPLSLQSMNNYSGSLSMTSSSSIISGPFNPPMNSFTGRDSLMSSGGGGGGGGGYRNNNNNNSNNPSNNHHNHHQRPMNKYNNEGGKMNHSHNKYDKMKHHRQHDNSNNPHGGGGHHHMGNQNSYNNNNMLNNKELAPRFKRNLVTTTTTNSVDDLQMRPAPNSLLFKASNIKPNPQQLPLNQSQNRSSTSSPGFSSSNVDNLIPPFNNAMQINTMNGKPQQSQSQNSSQQYNSQSSMPHHQPQSQQINFTTAAAAAAAQKSNILSQNSSQPASPQNNNGQGKEQQAVTKQGSVEKQKTKKDKGPSRDDVLKKVLQFINESLLEKKFLDNVQASRSAKNENGKAEQLITDSHNNNTGNGHANGKAEIIEECDDVSAATNESKDNSLTESIGDEENSVPTMEDVVKLYYDLKVPDKFLKDSMVKILNESLDKSDNAQETAIEFLIAMQKDKKLTANQTLDAFRGVINGMNEREKTIPKVTTHVASLLARSMTKKICKLTDIANYTDNGQHYPLLLLVLQQLHKIIGEDALVDMFNSTKINLMSNLPECDRTKDRLAEILDDRKLSFLQPLLRIESELWRQIKEDPQPTSFYKWIKDNVNPVRYSDPGFITALISVLLKYITQETTFPENSDPTKLPEKSQVEAEKKLLVSFSRILNAFLNGNLDLQLIAIYALQVFCYNSQFPKGMLLRWFTALYELEIVEEDAFLRWKEDITDVYPGKGKALFQVNSWLTWLQEAESEEEDDE